MPPYDVEDQCALLRGSLCLRPADLTGILSSTLQMYETFTLLPNLFFFIFVTLLLHL